MAGHKSSIDNFQSQGSQNQTNGAEIFQEVTQSIRGIQQVSIQSQPGLSRDRQEIEMSMFDHIGHNEIDIAKNGSILEATNVSIGNREIANTRGLNIEPKPTETPITAIEPITPISMKTNSLSVWGAWKENGERRINNDGIFLGFKDFSIFQRFQRNQMTDLYQMYLGLTNDPDSYRAPDPDNSKAAIAIPKATFPLSYKAITERTGEGEFNTHDIINPFSIPILYQRDRGRFVHSWNEGAKLISPYGQSDGDIISSSVNYSPNLTITSGEEYIRKSVIFDKGDSGTHSHASGDTHWYRRVRSITIENPSEDKCFMFEGSTQKFKKLLRGNTYPRAETLSGEVVPVPADGIIDKSKFLKPIGNDTSFSPIVVRNYPGDSRNLDVKFNPLVKDNTSVSIKIEYATWKDYYWGGDEYVDEHSYSGVTFVSEVSADHMKKNHTSIPVACADITTAENTAYSADKIDIECFIHEVDAGKFSWGPSGEFFFIAKTDSIMYFSAMTTTILKESLYILFHANSVYSWESGDYKCTYSEEGEDDRVVSLTSNTTHGFTLNEGALDVRFDIKTNIVSSGQTTDANREEIVDGAYTHRIRTGNVLAYVSSVQIDGKDSISEYKSLIYDTPKTGEFTTLESYNNFTLGTFEGSFAFYTNGTIHSLSISSSSNIKSLKKLYEDLNEVALIMETEEETYLLHCYNLKSIKGGNLLWTKAERNNTYASFHVIDNSVTLTGDEDILSESTLASLSNVTSLQIPTKQIASSMYFHNKYFIYNRDDGYTYSDTLSYGTSPVQRSTSLIHNAKVVGHGVGDIVSGCLNIPLPYKQLTTFSNTIDTMEYVNSEDFTMTNSTTAVILRSYLGNKSLFPSSGIPDKQTLIIPLTPAVDKDGQYLTAPTLLKHEYGIENISDHTEMGSKVLALQKPLVIDRKGIYESTFTMLSKGTQVLDIDNDEVYQLQNIIVFVKEASSLVFMYTEAGFTFQYSIPGRVIMNPIRQGEGIIFVTNKGIYSYMGDPILIYSYDFGTPFKGTLSLIDDKYYHIILMLKGTDEELVLHTLKLGVGSSVSDLGRVDMTSINGYIETSDWEEIRLIDSEEKIYTPSYGEDSNGTITSRPISLTQGGKVFNLREVHIYGKGLSGEFEILGEGTPVEIELSPGYKRTIIPWNSLIDFKQYSITVTSGELYRVRFIGMYIDD